MRDPHRIAETLKHLGPELCIRQSIAGRNYVKINALLAFSDSP